MGAEPPCAHLARGPRPLDVVPQYDAIQAGTWNGQTIAPLQAMRDQDLGDLNSRLNAMSATLELVTPQVNALR